MDRRDLERLGHHVVSRRVALGYRNRTDLANSLAFTLRTLADIEHGVRKASPGTYAILENKLAWAPGSIDTILAGGEPKETVVELRRTNTSAPSQGYALRPTSTPTSSSQLPAATAPTTLPTGGAALPPPPVASTSSAEPAGTETITAVAVDANGQPTNGYREAPAGSVTELAGCDRPSASAVSKNIYSCYPSAAPA
jgi:hypothetical protein